MIMTTVTGYIECACGQWTHEDCIKKFCMMLTEKNDLVQIVLFRRLLCSSCADFNIFLCNNIIL